LFGEKAKRRERELTERLTHPIRNSQLPQIQILHERLHEVDRYRGPRCNSSPTSSSFIAVNFLFFSLSTTPTGPTLYLKLEKSKLAPPFFLFSTSDRTPRKCVGTPCSAVHRSSTTASTIASGSKISDGYTMHAPCVQDAKFPRTRREERKEKVSTR
jgi:hypothetical protein